jgi:hypothetical protein
MARGIENYGNPPVYPTDHHKLSYGLWAISAGLAATLCSSVPSLTTTHSLVIEPVRQSAELLLCCWLTLHSKGGEVYGDIRRKNVRHYIFWHYALKYACQNSTHFYFDAHSFLFLMHTAVGIHSPKFYSEASKWWGCFDVSKSDKRKGINFVERGQCITGHSVGY